MADARVDIAVLPQPVSGGQPLLMRLALSLILLAVYALPLYWPPAGAPPVMPPPDAMLLERLFPGLPAWWVVGRLLCLVAGLVLLPGCALPARERVERGAVAPAPGAVRRALYVTLVLCAASLVIGAAGRLAQLVYVAAMFLPAFLLHQRREGAAAASMTASRAAVPAAVLAWLALRLPATLHSSRAADAVDMTLGFEALRRAAAADFNLLKEGIQAGGITALHLLPEGAGVLGWSGIPLTATAVQCLNLAWMAVAGIALGSAARRYFGEAAAAIAVVVLLFSPYALALPYFVSAVFLGSLCTAVLLALYLTIEEHGSPAALALMAPVAGIAATHPALAPAAIALLALAILSMARARTAPAVIAVSILLFVIIVVGSAPHLRDVLAFGGLASAQTQWTAMEAALFGQLPAEAADFASRAAAPQRFDIPLGAVLIPFAIPRTAVRMWGWNLFDPIGTALAGIGMVLCIRHRRDARARVLLVLLALALLPAMASSYDRPSLGRALVLPVPMALLAAAGFGALRARIAPHASSKLIVVLTAGSIAAGGLWLFDVVHPGLLSHSSTQLALDLVQRAAPAQALLLRHPRIDFAETEFYAAEIPVQPLRVRRFEGSVPTGENPDLILWSPGVEQSLQVGAALCRTWPQAGVYALADAAMTSRLFALRPAGPQPLAGWPAAQTTSGDCSLPLPTEALRVRDVMTEARQLLEQKRIDEALGVLRHAARDAFVHVPLFDTLARLLLARAADREALAEAEYWAWRATLPKPFTPQTFLTLAEIRAARGDFQAAVAAAVEARTVAELAGDEAQRQAADDLVRLYGGGGSQP